MSFAKVLDFLNGVPDIVWKIVIGVVFLILLILILKKNIIVVPQAESYVIESLGKYHKTWDAGSHLKIPLFQKIANVVSLKEQIYEAPLQQFVTSDNVAVSADYVIFYEVFAPKLYVYNAESPVTGLQNLSFTVLRNIIGKTTAEKILLKYDKISEEMKNRLSDAASEWGIRVTEAEIKNIELPEEVKESMAKQAIAERERKQAQLDAQAYRETAEARAEGDRIAAMLAAEGESKAMVTLAKAKAASMDILCQAEKKWLAEMQKTDYDKQTLKLKELEVLREMANGQATKIIVPSDMLVGSEIMGQ